MSAPLALHEELRKVEEQLSWLRNLATSLRAVIRCYDDQPLPERPARPEPKLVSNTAYRILETAGRPLHYAVLYERILTAGVHVPGRNATKNLGAHLSADSRFVSLGKGLWTLRSPAFL